MTIYDTIGGETTVGAVVDELYRRTLDDLHLKPELYRFSDHR